MNVVALIDALVKTGATPEMILAAVKSQEEDIALKREDARQRKIRQRQKYNEINTHVTVTERDVTVTSQTLPPDGSDGFPHPSLTSFTPHKEITPKGVTKKAPQDIVFPDWLPQAEWQEFREMRKKIRKPMTLHAERLAIGKLEKLRSRGHDPTSVLNQSILNDYQDIYEPRAEQNGYRKPEQPKSQIQRAVEATERARLARERGGSSGAG